MGDGSQSLSCGRDVWWLLWIPEGVGALPVFVRLRRFTQPLRKTYSPDIFKIESQPFPETGLRSPGQSRLVTHFASKGNGSATSRIQSTEGVMNQHQPKKHPTRRAYASALKTIRVQLQTIESQSDTILRQNQFMVMMRMKDRRPARPRKPEVPWGLPNGWIN